MKRWLIIGIVAIAVIGALIGYSISQGETSDKETSNQGKPVTAGTIQVPDGPRIQVKHVDFPEGVELTWQKLGMNDFMLGLDGTLKNVSGQTNSYEITFILDGEVIDYWPRLGVCVLQPGEEVKFSMGMIGWSSNSKVLEIRVKISDASGTPVTPIQPALPPTPALQPEPTQNSGQTIFAEAPKNPQTPAEVVAAFYFLWNKGDCNGVMKFMSREVNVSADDLESHREEAFGGRTLEKMEIEIFPINENESSFRRTFYYTDGTAVRSTRVKGLIKENGNWKIK